MRRILILSVIITTALYLLVSLLSVSAYPPEYGSWLEYIEDMGNLDGIKAVPAFFAAQHYLGDAGIAVLMLALFAVILTSLIGNLLALSRLLHAAGREGEAPESFARLNKRGIPDKATYAIVAVSIFMPLLGRTAIGWIVDVTTIGATIIYGLISHAVYKSARSSGRLAEKCTGMAGIVLMVCFLLLLLVPGLLPFHAMETESYVLFIVWSLLGLFYFRILLRRDRYREYGRSVIVWIVFLTMVLFASMMWVSRATENAADVAVKQIYEYHQNHPNQDADDAAEERREVFLQKQADQISKTNILYSGVSLALFLLSMGIMLSNFKDNQKLGRRLIAAEEEAKTAQKIAELKESISVLLNNMPALSFYKDAETGVYLACNQVFAEYARKASPEDVVGLTDFDIFDTATATHFTEADRRALSMDKPYILYEDVPDPKGVHRQLQTTKLKFYDANGRLCLLGMSMDVTEMERVRKESEQAQAAYKEESSTRAIYENMVSALSGDYFNLYYLDLLTDEYIMYGSETKDEQRTSAQRGTNFFESIRKNAFDLIYKDDRDRIIKELNKKNMLDRIKKHGTFIIQYRLLIDGVPTYVNLKATCAGDDETHMIIGISNIDAQVKDRITAQRAINDRRSYHRLSALNGNLIALYYVDPESEQYTEFGAKKDYEELDIAKQGSEFFKKTRENSFRAIYPDDQEIFRELITKENILRTIERDGVFILDYRLMLGGRPIYARFKAAQIEENGKPLLIIGLLDEDAQIRREQEYEHDLSVARKIATKDALTGVNNKYAYFDTERRLNDQIENGDDLKYAIVVCDINDLKGVNDEEGHKKGDKYIQKACNEICGIFKRSHVYRVGGDEFAVICQNYDYEHIEELSKELRKINDKNKERNDVQIAFGFARSDEGRSVEAVFELADRRMYAHKTQMKAYKMQL